MNPAPHLVQVTHAKRIETRERELAKQRQRTGQDRGRAVRHGLDGADSAQTNEPAHQRKTRARVAKAVGTSHDTLAKARHVMDLAENPNTSPEVAEVAKSAAGELSKPDAVVNREHRAVVEAEQRHAEKTIVDAIDERVPNAQAERARKDEVLQRPPSLHAVYNINGTGRPAGTAEAHALRKLRKDAPELHAEVLAGRLSAHAAMVKAGFRPHTFTVPVNSPDSVARALRKHLSPEQLAELRRGAFGGRHLNARWSPALQPGRGVGGHLTVDDTLSEGWVVSLQLRYEGTRCIAIGSRYSTTVSRRVPIGSKLSGWFDFAFQHPVYAGVQRASSDRSAQR